MKEAKLCFTLISLGRPFHSLATLYLADFIRKFEVHVGPGEGKTITIFSSEIIFAVIKNIYFSFAARGSGGKKDNHLQSTWPICEVLSKKNGFEFYFPIVWAPKMEASTCMRVWP